jgi:hypothetical protein
VSDYVLHRLDQIQQHLREQSRTLSEHSHTLARIARAIGAGGMTDAEIRAVTDRLGAAARRLEGALDEPEYSPVTSEISSKRKAGVGMALPQEMTDVLNRIDTDTNALAAVVTDLRSRISTGMTQEDVTAVQNKLGEVAGRLEGIASNPAAPVPPSPPPAALRRK